MFDTMGFLHEDNNVVSKVIALIQFFLVVLSENAGLTF